MNMKVHDFAIICKNRLVIYLKNKEKPIMFGDKKPVVWSVLTKRRRHQQKEVLWKMEMKNCKEQMRIMGG